MNKANILIFLCFMATTSAFSQQVVAIAERGSFTDQRDNQTYKWLKIGSQIWMVQNLNYETPKGSSIYNEDTTLCKTYGRLYDWNTALKACPSGWHLPLKAEWTVLSEYLGDQAGEKLKELGTKHWNGPDAVVRGDSGFNALPAGFKGKDPYDRAYYDGLGNYSFFWTASTGTPFNKGIARYLSYLDEELLTFENWKIWGYSVRCVKDIGQAMVTGSILGL